MFHQPAEKHSFCKQLTGRVEAEKVMEKKSSRPSELWLLSGFLKQSVQKILNKYSVYKSCKRVWKQEAIYISTLKLADWKLLYVGRDSSELKPPLTSSFRARSSQGAFLAYAAI